MNGVHLHLLVNHVPILATWLAVPLLLLALALPRERGYWVSAAVLVVIGAVSAVVTLWTGEPAEEAVRALAEVDAARVGAHESAAYVGLVASLVAAAGTCIAAVALRGAARVRARARVSLVLTLVAAGVLSWVGYTGGLIRHPEIREAPAAEPPPAPPTGPASAS